MLMTVLTTGALGLTPALRFTPAIASCSPSGVNARLVGVNSVAGSSARDWPE